MHQSNSPKFLKSFSVDYGGPKLNYSKLKENYIKKLIKKKFEIIHDQRKLQVKSRDPSRLHHLKESRQIMNIKSLWSQRALTSHRKQESSVERIDLQVPVAPSPPLVYSDSISYFARRIPSNREEKLETGRKSQDNSDISQFFCAQEAFKQTQE